MEFGFIIPTCCKTQLHINQLLRCISSIRIHYPNHKIILINDYDEMSLKTKLPCDENIEVIQSLVQGSADQQVFKIFLDSDLNKMVFIQDSMILNKKLVGIDSVNDIQFLWHFTNHRLQWDKIKEPTTTYNINHKIHTHTDLIKHALTNDFRMANPDFYSFAMSSLKDKSKWCGCFGCCCIITKSALKKLNDLVPFIDTFIGYSLNRLRRTNESIFALICHFCYPDKNFHNSYDGLYFNGIKVNKYSGTKTGFDNLRWCYCGNYVNKVSFNR